MNDDFKDGFSLESKSTLGRSNPRSLALVSLGVALRSYFATSCSGVGFNFIAESPTFDLELTREYQEHGATEYDFHGPRYAQLCFQSIVHFQHFIELTCKELLYLRHPLHAVDARREPVILDMLLEREQVPPEQVASLQTVEFTTTLERLCKLTKSGRLGNGDLTFIRDAREWLEKLNGLRNRMLHFGTFVLRYPSLDHIVGKMILPFAQKMLNLPRFSGFEAIWKYKPPACGVDPIEETVKHFATEKYDLGKVALLKELGASAYANPLVDTSHLPADLAGNFFPNAETIARAKSLAKAESTGHIRQCPICGVEAMAVHEDIEAEDYNPESGYSGKAYSYTYRVHCTCCGFDISDPGLMRNPREYGLPIEGFWESRDLD